MALKIYSTLSRKLEDFKPMHEGRIGLYCCGITVYDYCHLGHARLLCWMDAFVRFLRFTDWEVDYVRNITDIDDKILNRANERGVEYTQLTEEMIHAMHQDELALGNLLPGREPRATLHMDEIIELIGKLEERGYAYRASNGDVYYRVKRFEGYGKLSGRNPDELLAGARIEIGELKEDPRDFALWKAAKPGEVSWSSPWGDGRPGWHIECSAMSMSCLGTTFDIHAGGPDLIFPHHENEIAQSEGATGSCFANYWLHCGPLRVDNEKMSKSLGNFFTIRDVLESHQAEVVRFLLLSSHYRSPINYSEDSLHTAHAQLERFYAAMRDFGDVAPADAEQLASSEYTARFIEVLNDDFNTPEAIALLHEIVSEMNPLSREGSPRARELAAVLKGLGGILGFLQQDPQAFRRGGSAADDDAEIDRLVEARQQARKDKDFARADEIRDQLTAMGVVIEDTREGAIWRRG